jgi:hypothetical protein
VSEKQDSNWEGFRDYVKKIASVSKKELGERLAEEKREKEEEKRAMESEEAPGRI